jgi:transposase
MFTRIKASNKSGKKKVQICECIREGSKVRQVILRHVGTAKDEAHLLELRRLAEVIKIQIKEEREGPFFFPLETKQIPENLPSGKHEQDLSEAFSEETPQKNSHLVNLDNLTEQKRIVEGFHEVFGNLFQSLGFNQILPKKKSQLLRDLVLARIATPASKHRSQEMLAVDFGIDIHLDRIYRMMDSLIEQKEAFEKQVFLATQRLCFGKVNMLLFDVTTLYFESIEEDELKNFGYSKDQKFHSVQVVLALATTENGLPIGYKLFPGNTADVSTLQAALNEWREQLPIGEVRVIGDAAMMSEANLTALEAAGIKYIVAARLKKIPKDIQQEVIQKKGEIISINNEQHFKQEYPLNNERRLIVTYNEKRARKNRNDRLRVLEKVQKKIGSGKNLKKLVSNRGYQKFIKTEGSGKLTIDEEKISAEEQWDGLHGIISNDRETSAKDLLTTYRRLWIIEESFRIQKNDLSIRPIYHFKPERIEAHILLCYLAFSLIRYAEHRVKLQKEKISIQEMRRGLWRIQSSILKDHETGNYYRVPSQINPIAKKIYQTFGIIRNQKIQKIDTCSAQKSPS